ncbi:phage Mu F like family protein [Caldimonas brevitalea]|uniref:Phage Mu F like family protein n=1 Tax=Caldimonas brevitalea TaxID=413882 RepID=A0A0G3BHL4_9BURK|nr:phage Mu F like family protein [Caldimonas brevitalea]
MRALNAQAYQVLHTELQGDLRALAEYEAGYQFELFRDVLPVQISVARVSADQVYAAAFSQPFRGRLLREWAAGIEQNRMVRIRDAVRMGVVENQTNAQIVQRIRGTRALKYTDGLIEIDRRDANSVVRTAVQHVAAHARETFYAANEDLVKAVVWSATLDSRTSELCRIRDGLQYTQKTHKPIGHKIPWLGGPGRLHWCCRSSSTPVVKSWQELGLDLGEAPAGTRASMDGQVPAETTYAEWLKRQSGARQDQILGPERGKLLRQGGLTLDKFYNEKGRYLTLEQLRERDAAAFRRAGL